MKQLERDARDRFAQWSRGDAISPIIVGNDANRDDLESTYADLDLADLDPALIAVYGPHGWWGVVHFAPTAKGMEAHRDLLRVAADYAHDACPYDDEWVNQGESWLAQASVLTTWLSVYHRSGRTLR